ncbi:MAG: SDR family NAD(P)-dependent oxidoreductase [Actinomycetota bacterium]|nr:SDR family oxidoreductase [Actinomycetota bacterium]
MNLQGKVVAITGAAQGIGRAMALEFAKRGAHLSLSDIDGSLLDALKQQVEAAGAKAIASVTDVTKEEQIDAMIKATVDELGSLDVFVSNAGVSVSGSAEAMPLEDWHWIMDINVWSHVYAIRAALPLMKAQGSGHLVHVSSAAGIMGTPALSAYCMTKFAVFGLAESLAISLHGTGIGVSVVCPLWVNTDISLHGRTTMDPSLGLDVEASMELAREMLRQAGIPPEKVASDVADAVQAGRFLVLPHPEVLGWAQKKWADPDTYIAKAAARQGAQKQLFGEA